MLSQRILTLFVLIAVGPPTVLGLVLFFLTRAELTETSTVLRADLERVLLQQRSRLNEERAARLSGAIDRHLLSVEREVAVLAQLPGIVRLEAAASQAILDGIELTGVGYASLALTAVDGRIVASVGRGTETRIESRRELNTALANRTYVSSVKRGNRDRPAHILVYRAIHDQRGQPVGCLVAALPAAVLAAQADVSGSLDGEFIYVASGEGLVLAHPAPSQSMTRREPFVGPFRRLSRPTHGSFREPDFLVSYAQCDRLDWRVVVAMPIASALEPIHHTTGELELILGNLLLAVRQNSLMTVLVFLVIAALTARLVAKDIVTPIDEVVRGIRKITQGDLGSRVPVRRHDEVGFLASAFNRMASELRHSREELVTSHHRTEHIMRSVTDSLVVIDARQRITAFNPTALETLGYSGSDLIGKPIGQLFGESAADSDLVRRLEREDEVCVHETALRTSFGESLPVLLSCSALRDHKGRHAGAVIIARDITDQLQVEDDRARLAAIVQGSTDLIATLDLEGHMLFLNEAGRRLLGISGIAQLLGSTLADFSQPASRQPLADALAATMRDGRGECELDLQPLGGAATVPAHVTFSLLRDARTARPTLIAAIGRDIAERRLAMEKLERYAAQLEMSNRDLEQFAFVASHDLREPLRKLHNLAELLVKRHAGQLDAKGGQILRFMIDSSSRMLCLIKDLLEYSRLGGHDRPVIVTPVDSLVDAALANLSLAVRESGAVIERDPMPTLPVHADQLTMVFQNLLSNAIKFHGERPPHIRLGCRREPGRWLFWVRDDGIGIDPAYAERIFVIFQRLHPVQRFEGTGIGLAICKKIVDSHGGRIWVESREGEGATFFFTIPDRRDSLTHSEQERTP